MTLGGELYTIGAKQDWCSLRCTGQCPVPWLEHLTNWLLSGFLSARPLKFIGLSNETTVNFTQWSTALTAAQSAAHKSEVSLQRQDTPNCPVCHRTVRCSKRTEDCNGQLLQIPKP
jgi:hypothetical protein